jgi:uncharacterized protein (DUF1330 family)
MPVPSSGATTVPAPAPGQAPARPWTDQPAFSIVRLNVRDARGFGDYLTGHLPTIVAAGGRFLAAGALPQTVEGDWPLRRMVIHQWPSANAFFAWYESSAYAPWRQIRQRAADSDVVLVQGVASSAPSEAAAPAFAVVDAAVQDGSSFGRYEQGHVSGLRAAGGEYLVAGGRFQIVEGMWFPRRVELQRWPSMAAFRAWYESAEYRPWRDLRWAAAQADVALLEGLSEAQKRERGMP